MLGLATRWLDSAALMRASRSFSNLLFRDVAVWLCVLAVLALISLATTGLLATMLTLAAVIAWVLTGSRSSPADEHREREPAAPLLVMLAPLFVALSIASAIASDEWYWFTVMAIAFPLTLLWRHVYWRWQDRRAPHETA